MEGEGREVLGLSGTMGSVADSGSMTSSTLLKSAYELAREERIKQYVTAH